MRITSPGPFIPASARFPTMRPFNASPFFRRGELRLQGFDRRQPLIHFGF